jgi:putative transposase
MKKAFKYKIKPTFKQRASLNQMFGCARFIYNWGLDRKIKAYQNEKKNLTYIQLAKELTTLKKTEEHGFLNSCANECLQQSLRNLDNAFTSFFKARKGFPKFKAKKRSKDVCKFINSVHFDFNEWKVKIPRVGWVKLCRNRTFDTANVKIGTLTVSRDKCGDLWVTIMTETNETCPPRTKVDVSSAVGVDLGIKDYAILSDGTRYGNPKFLEKGQERLQSLNKRFSKSTRGSRRRERLKLKIARLHRRISNRRANFLHQLSSSLVKRFDTVCMENLNVDGMLKNHKLSNSVQSAAWGEFARQVAYKCQWHGKNLVFIGRFEPSSKTCHNCGYVKSDLKLSDREWRCPSCGSILDRDLNAAKNILTFGLHPQALVGKDIKIPAVTGIEMDGEGNDIKSPSETSI